MAGAPLKNNSPSDVTSRVLLDTNFLLLPFQRRIDIFTEIEHLLNQHVHFIVLPQILQELESLILRGKEKERRAAKSAQQMVKQYCHVTTDLPPKYNTLDADTALVEYAKTHKAIVATNDRTLRKRLSKESCQTIYLRKLAVLALSE